MAGPLLRSGSLREYNVLGVLGNPVFNAAVQTRAAVARHLGPEAADILAIPQINEAGSSVDWYAPFDGPVVPWSAATVEERQAAHATLERMRGLYERHGERLLAELAVTPRRDTAPEIFARMLPMAMHIPDEGHIHLVSGRPVLTFWGFDLLNAAPGTHVLRDLRVTAPAAIPTAAPPVLDVPPPSTVPPRAWWRRWLWLLPLFLLLLLLSLFGLRACSVPVAVPSWVPVVPGLTVIAPQERGPDGVLLTPGIAVPGGGVGVSGGDVPAPDGHVPLEGQGATTDQTQPDSSQSPVPPQIKDDKSADPNSPKNSPESKSETDKTAETDKKPEQPPKPPLIIPPDAQKNGGTAFLDGHWQSHSGLMDSETGRPLDVEYDFKDGKGRAIIHRSDGTTCSATATAAMAAGKLVIDQTGDAVCPDGQRFDRSKVECRAGKDGKAECQGIHAGGKDAYKVEIVK